MTVPVNQNPAPTFAAEVKDFAKEHKVLSIVTLGLAIVVFAAYTAIKNCFRSTEKTINVATPILKPDNTNKSTRLNKTINITGIGNTSTPITSPKKEENQSIIDEKKKTVKTPFEDSPIQGKDVTPTPPTTPSPANTALKVGEAVFYGQNTPQTNEFQNLINYQLEGISDFLQGKNIEPLILQEIINGIKNCKEPNELGFFINNISPNKVPGPIKYALKQHLNGLGIRTAEDIVRIPMQDLKKAQLANPGQIKPVLQANKENIRNFFKEKTTNPDLEWRYKHLKNEASFENFFQSLLKCNSADEISAEIDKHDAFKKFGQELLKEFLIPMGLIKIETLFPRVDLFATPAPQPLVLDPNVLTAVNLPAKIQTPVPVIPKDSALVIQVKNDLYINHYLNQIRIEPGKTLESKKNEFYDAIAALEKQGLITDLQFVRTYLEKAIVANNIERYALTALCNTLSVIKQTIELNHWQIGSQDFYVKKAVLKINGLKQPNPGMLGKYHTNSQSFVITKNKNLIVSFDRIAGGSYKKVSQAYDISKGLELVKDTVRQQNPMSNAVQETKDEKELQHRLATHQNRLESDIYDPVEICSLSLISEKNLNGANQKYVFYENRIVGDSLHLFDPQVSVNQIFAGSAAALRGVAHAHSQGVAHLDLKPENIFLPNRQKADLKVADFGFARALNSANAFLGTRIFMPPEVYGKDYDIASENVDSYAMGGTLLIYLLFLSEASAQDAYSLYIDLYRYQTNSIQYREKLEACFSKVLNKVFLDPTKNYDQKRMILGLVDTIGSLLELDPTKRATCQQTAPFLDYLEKRYLKNENPNQPAYRPPTRYSKLQTLLNTNQPIGIQELRTDQAKNLAAFRNPAYVPFVAPALNIPQPYQPAHHPLPRFELPPPIFAPGQQGQGPPIYAPGQQRQGPPIFAPGQQNLQGPPILPPVRQQPKGPPIYAPGQQLQGPPILAPGQAPQQNNPLLRIQEYPYAPINGQSKGNLVKALIGKQDVRLRKEKLFDAAFSRLDKHIKARGDNAIAIVFPAQDGADHQLSQGLPQHFNEKFNNLNVQIFSTQGFYEYIPSRTHYEVFVDFANKHLGGGFLGNGFVQEERMAFEFPQFAKYILDQTKNTRCQVRTRTDAGDPTPVIFSNAYRVQAIDNAIYGKKLESTSLDDLQSKTVDLPTAEGLNILAISAPNLRESGQNPLSNEVLRDLYNTFHAGFMAAKKEANGTSVLINSGPCGCGDYRNHSGAVYLLHRLAAAQQGVNLKMHGYKNTHILDQIWEQNKANFANKTIDECIGIIGQAVQAYPTETFK